MKPGHAAAIRALQDNKTPLEIKMKAAEMLGETAPEDLIFAVRGEPVFAAPRPPVVDYVPHYQEPQNWLGDFLDGMASACVFVAGGFCLGVMVAVIAALRFWGAP